MRPYVISFISTCLLLACLVSTSYAVEPDPPELPPSMYFGEIQSAANGDGVANRIQLFGSKFFTKHVGAWFWSSTNPAWSEAYIGPIIAITDELQIGVAAGFETASTKPLRVGGMAGYYSGDHYAEILGEYSDGGYWIRADGNYQLTDWFGIGGHAETDLGVGPRLRLRLPPDTIPIPIEIWGAPLFDWSANGAAGTYLNGIAGLRINL